MRYKKSSFLFGNVVTILLAINVLAFILQWIIPGFTDLFVLVSKDVLARPWILLTSMFLHGSLPHLLFNMYALFIFGSLIEQKIGSKRFSFVYFLSGILASLLFTVLMPSSAALGASGAVMGILGVTIMLMPDLRVLFFFFIPMSLRTAGIVFILIDVLGAFGIGIPGIANVAHLAGVAVGLIYGYYLLKNRKKSKALYTYYYDT
ncbi:rhomboid family intramembrane serine protease [archaeon]|nr:rhomboid family intramembrane serine protease [archaeon]